MRTRTFRVGYLFAGIGGAALGFADSKARLGDDTARFQNVGGVDIDGEACADFERLTGARATLADVAMMSPAALRDAWGASAPDTVFLSPPCKGYSRLLSNKSAATPKYEALNRLVLQGLWLLCETWPDAPPATIVLENVPGIVSRGADILDAAKRLLMLYGYRLDDRQHDCGELGGLAQHRKRYLLVARCPRRVPAFIYRPPTLRVRGCGEVLGRLPLPLTPDAVEAGPLHVLPRLSWRTWMRLAAIPAGGDWRDLPGVVPEGAKRRSVFARYDLRGWDQTARTVAGDGSNGGFGVADPRWHNGALGVVRWEDATGVVTGNGRPVSGRFTVADPRLVELLALEQTARGADTFKGRPGLLRVQAWEDPSRAVTGSASVTGSNGSAAIADPRLAPDGHWRNGTLGVLRWEDAAATVIGNARIDAGPFAVADPREAPAVPPVIEAPDGTWHRPMTTLDLAALQDYADDIRRIGGRLAGARQASWRERIGNGVPKRAATAIGDAILMALLAGALGTWTLGSTGIWVRRDGRSEHEWSAEA